MLLETIVLAMLVTSRRSKEYCEFGNNMKLNVNSAMQQE
jgi:hypothetical protein